jgi:hypothetical protein
LAEQSALRAFQHLHVLQVEKGAGTSSIATRSAAASAQRHDVSEIDSDGGRGALFLGKSADRERRSIVSIAGVDRHGWRECRDILERNDVVAIKRSLIEHRDGNRDVLQALFSSTRGDDDVTCSRSTCLPHRSLGQRRYRHRGDRRRR